MVPAALATGVGRPILIIAIIDNVAETPVSGTTGRGVAAAWALEPMAQSTQRQKWIEQAREGNQAAVSMLLAAYHVQLKACANARMGQVLRSRMEPEDVLQQVYLEVLRQIDQFEGRDPETFVNWVLTILDHRIINIGKALQRQKRDVAREIRPTSPGSRESCFNLLDRLYGHSGTPSRVVRRDEAVGALLASLSRLSEAHRQVIQLRYLQGRSVREVATLVGKSEAAVVALTRRALDAMRQCMDGLGEFTRGL